MNMKVLLLLQKMKKMPNKELKNMLKRIKNQEPKKCTACIGSGYYDSKNNPKCQACNGTGLKGYM